MHTKPIDPSPTPWNFGTWGFYCDTCDKFFDLPKDGRVIEVGQDGNDVLLAYEHKTCGQPARYIGYDHNVQ